MIAAILSIEESNRFTGKKISDQCGTGIFMLNKL
jgi:hypothetical protein